MILSTSSIRGALIRGGEVSGEDFDLWLKEHEEWVQEEEAKYIAFGLRMVGHYSASDMVTAVRVPK